MYETMIIPADAQYELWGWHYKIGAHGLLYIGSGKRWARKSDFLPFMVIEVLTHSVNSKKIKPDEITGEAKAYLDRASMAAARVGKARVEYRTGEE